MTNNLKTLYSNIGKRKSDTVTPSFLLKTLDSLLINQLSAKKHLEYSDSVLRI